MKKLYIMLSRFPDRGSKWLQVFTGCYYTHAAIGLGEDLNTFYSFKTRGFMVETISRYLKPGRAPFACQVYELPVSERKYASVKATIQRFIAQKTELHYTRLGLVLGLLRIPYRRHCHYFCSQFVAEVLQNSRVTHLRKKCSLYMPGDLRRLSGARLIFCGNMSELVRLYRLAPQMG